MGRRKKVDRPIPIIFNIPTSVWDKVNAELYSEVEGRVPYSARSALIVELLSEWLRDRGVTI